MALNIDPNYVNKVRGQINLTPDQQQQLQDYSKANPQYGSQLTPEQQDVLNRQFDAYHATPEELINRYSAISSGPQDYINKVQGLFGDQDRLNYTQYTTMASILGRAPTADEYSSLAPTFQGPNGITNGRAAVTQYAQQVKNDPTNPNSQANPNNPGYGSYLQPYNDPVSQEFQSILGRAPTADELQHFSSILASGQTDNYGLQNYLKQMPEYTNAQDAQFRTGLNNELSSYDTNEFNRQKQGVYADYAARGFSPGNSPSLDYALTDLMGQIAQNRSSYLANLSAQQYGGNKQLAEGNYQNSLNQMYNQSQQNRQRQQQLADSYVNRGNEGADYLTQMNDYMRMINQQNQGRNVLHTGDWLNLGLSGANTAAKFYGASQAGQSNPYSYLDTI